MPTFPIGHSAHKLLERNRQAIRKIDNHLHTHATISIRHATQADTRTLRGIPAIGKGVAGVQPGTNPTAILNREDAA